MVVVLCELGRSAYLPLGGDQVGNVSVWSSETTGFGLQILPQVLHMSESYKKKSFHKIAYICQRRDIYKIYKMSRAGLNLFETWLHLFQQYFSDFISI